MAQLDRATLKLFFETGDFPTETEFADFIDSVTNIVDDNPATGVVTFQKDILFSDFQPNPTGAGTFTVVGAIPAGGIPYIIKVFPTVAWTPAGGGGAFFNQLRDQNGIILANPSALDMETAPSAIKGVWVSATRSDLFAPPVTVPTNAAASDIDIDLALGVGTIDGLAAGTTRVSVVSHILL